MSILIEAEKLVNGDRQSDYDSPKSNFDRIAKIASVMCNKELTAIDCVNVLIATKLAREAFKHKRDNIVDAAGYLEVKERIINND